MIDRRILDAAVNRWGLSRASESMMLRGSYVTGLHVGRQRRHCDDLDFLALYPTDCDRAANDIGSALAAFFDDEISFDVERIEQELIFAETEFPGVRLSVPVRVGDQAAVQLQIDVAFNDPLPQAPSRHELSAVEPSATVLITPVETLFAWKLHGLVEFEGLSWRPKDVADLWLLNQHAPMDTAGLVSAIRVAMESRDAPIWRLDRLMRRKMGRASGSLRRWAKHVQEHPEGGLPDLLGDVVDTIAKRIDPVWKQLRGDGPFDCVAPPTLGEMWRLRANSNAFRSYAWDGQGTVFVCERSNPTTLPPPLHAETNKKFRDRQVRRESRGITFAASGQLLARPYAQFERLENLTAEQFATAEVLAKLDGSLVFPTPTDAGWRWRTRRGVSEIAAAAGRFAKQDSADYDGLIDDCLKRERTPIFEWCSRSRWIVFDHPFDRLVLTGVRDHQTGALLPYQQLLRLADQYGVELIERIDTEVDLPTWIERVRSWQDCEGCIVRLANGLQFKIKSDRYTWLHQAVEGPDRDRARWYLWLIAAGEQLLYCSQGREMVLDDYVAQIDKAMREFCQQASDIAAGFADDHAGRKKLAEHVKPSPNALSRLVFVAHDGGDVAESLREMTVLRCQRSVEFRSLVKLIRGPLWEDG